LTRLITFLVLLTLGLVLMFMFFLSHIVQYGITAKTGFPTHVEELRSNMLRGSLYARTFEIRNPGHYEHSGFIDIDRLDIKASPASFFRDRVVVERFEIEIPRLTGVRNADGLVNLEEFRTVIEEMFDERKEQMPGKEGVIERFRLKIDKVVVLDYSGDGSGKPEEYDVNLLLELTEVTSLRSVAPEVLRQFAAAGVSFESDAVFAGAVPEKHISRVRSGIGAGEGAAEETSDPQSMNGKP